MAVYMTPFDYTADAWAAFVRSPEDRSAGIKALIEGVGGRIIDVYYSFGEYDGLLIFEAPDETAAVAALIAAVAPGHLRATKTTALFTLEQGVEAMKKASELTYAGPKG